MSLDNIVASHMGELTLAACKLRAELADERAKREAAEQRVTELEAKIGDLTKQVVDGVKVVEKKAAA